MKHSITLFIGNQMNTKEGMVYEFENFSKLSKEFDTCKKGRKYHAYYVRGELDPVERKDVNLKTTSIIIIDGDSGLRGKSAPDPKAVHEGLVKLGFNHFIYTTHSHTKEINKFRCVVETDEYSKEQLKTKNQGILKALKAVGIGIKNVKEMNSWSQAWFVPTRDNPEDGLYEFYSFNEGKAYQGEEIDKGSIDANTNIDGGNIINRFVCSGSETLDELYDNIRTGKEYHESLNNISYQLIKDGMSVAHVKHILKMAMDGSAESGSDRWQIRYDDIDRTVEGAVLAIAKESEFDIDKEKDPEEGILDIRIPWPPGLLGDLCDSAYNSMNIPHKELAFMSGIGAIAAICGRAFNFTPALGLKTMGLNVYMTIVADTGVGKSGMSNFLNYIFHEMTDKEWSYLGSATQTGPKALADELILQGSMLSVTTEAGISMQTSSGNQGTLLGYKLSIYTQSGYGQSSDKSTYSDKDNIIVKLRAPSYSQLSESTPGVLYQAMNDTDALDKGLLPRNSLFVIPSNRILEINDDASYNIPKAVKDRLEVLMDHCSRYQSCIEKVIPTYVIFDNQKMRNESREIQSDLLNRSDSGSVDRKIDTRLHVKLLRFASLCTVFNDGAKPDGKAIIITDSAWDWAKKMLAYETRVSKVFMDGMATDSNGEAIQVVMSAIRRLLRGEHKSKKAQGRVPIEYRKMKMVRVQVLRDLLAKSPVLIKISSGDKSNNIRTGLDKVLEALDGMGKIRWNKKARGPNGHNVNAIVVRHEFND